MSSLIFFLLSIYIQTKTEQYITKTVKSVVMPRIIVSKEVPLVTIMPTPTTTPSPTPVPTITPLPAKKTLPSIPAKEITTLSPTVIPTTIQLATNISEHEAYFDQYSNQYGVDKNLLKKIAQCESGMRANATNGIYGGMYQFASSTWVSTRAQMGLDTNPDLRFDSKESIQTASFKIANNGKSAWSGCL
jgi:hypothetical protein